MKATDLRKSILQAAVQGKLVPQDKNDEPASELLKRIQSEKAALIKAGKLKEEKALPPIAEDEIPYDLPEGWVWCRVGAISHQITSGSREWAKYYSSSGATFIRMGNLSRNNYQLKLSSIQHVTPPYGMEGTRTSLQANDILVSITGEVGLLGLVPPFLGEAYINQHVAMVRCSPNVHPRYIANAFLTPLCIEQFNAPQRGIKNSFRLTDLLYMIIPIPPLTEQQRIVAKVDELMTLCDKLEAAEKELDALEQHFAEYLPKSILQAAVQGKLVPQDKNDEPASEFLKRIQVEKAKLIKESKLKKDKPLPPITEDEIPYDLPEGWEWYRLGRLCDYGNTQNADPNNIPDDSWILELEDVEKDTGRILNRKFTPGYKPQSTKHIFGSGDILYSKLRPYLNKVLIADDDGYSTSEILPLRFPEEISTEYILRFFRSPVFVEYANACSYGVKMPRLGTNDGKMALIPLPPLAEQQRIVEKVDELMALCDELKCVHTQPIDHSNIVPFPAKRQLEVAEPIRMAARGKIAAQPSKQHTAALDDLLEMMDDE